MDKLKRVLSGNDDTQNDENRGIMGDVCEIIWLRACAFLRSLVCPSHNILEQQMEKRR